MTVRNDGFTPADGVIVTDTPFRGANITDVAWAEVPRDTTEGNVWTVGYLAAGEELTATVTGVVADAVATDGVINDVIVDAPRHEREDPTGPAPDGNCVPNPEGVSADADQCDSVTVEAHSELKVVKYSISAPDEWTPGGVIEWAAEVTNESPDSDASVQVTDIPRDGLDADAEWVSVSDGDIIEGVWQVGDLDPGHAARTFVATALVDD